MFTHKENRKPWLEEFDPSSHLKEQMERILNEGRISGNFTSIWTTHLAIWPCIYWSVIAYCYPSSRHGERTQAMNKVTQAFGIQTLRIFCFLSSSYNWKPNIYILLILCKEIMNHDVRWNGITGQWKTLSSWAAHLLQFGHLFSFRLVPYFKAYLAHNWLFA